VSARDDSNVPTEDLRSAVEDALCRHFDRACSVVEFRREPSQYRSSFALEEIRVRIDDGRTLEIVFKDVSRRGLSVSARAAKPAFLYDSRREIRTYVEALNPSRLGTAVCYGAVEAAEAGRHWLFLEKVEGRTLYQVGEFQIWREAAAWLAGLHERFAKRVASLRHAIPLLKYDGDYYRLWPKRALAFVEKSTSDATRRRLERIVARYERVVERLTSLPVTLIHGEFYASNVLVQQTSKGLRVCAVDWEMAAIGPNLIDLAALIAGRWTEQEKAELVTHYKASAEPLAALADCRLHLAMQWLGWAAEWSPPTHHAHDWLAEALTLADQLGL
jgi:aminoglycoside phosphotransferase (APT) family kinase protein